MGKLIPFNKPYPLNDGEDSVASDKSLRTILKTIEGLSQLLDDEENEIDPRRQKQAEGTRTDMTQLLIEQLIELGPEERENLPLDIKAQIRDVIEVNARNIQYSVIGDGTLNIKHITIVINDWLAAHQDGKQPGEVSPAERAYLRWMMEQYSQVQLSTLNTRLSQQMDKPDIYLEEIFVHLDIQHTRSAVGQDNDAESRVPTSVLDSVNRRKVLVVLGAPGSGKSTLLNYLTFYLAGARLNPLDGRYLAQLSLPQRDGQSAVNWQHGALLPIRVTLRDFVEDLPQDKKSLKKLKGSARLLMKHISHQLALHNMEDFEETLRKALRQGQCLVMLDGLDEVGTEFREIVRESIDDFIKSNEGNRFIMTCRKLSYTKPDWRLDNRPVTLAPLSDEAIASFIDHWYDALAKRGLRGAESARQKAKELKEAVVDFEDDFIRNPMLLTVVCILHHYRLEPARERARLYQNCIELLMWKWAEPRLTPHNGWEDGITDQLGVEEGHLLKGLCELAYLMHKEQETNSSATSLPRSTVLDVLSKHLNNDREKAAQFCDYVEQQAGLLVGQGQPANGEPMYAFLHRSFKEFLAAWYIIDNYNFTHMMVGLAHESDIWHEVLLLAVGHMVFNNKEYQRPLAVVSAMVPDNKMPGDEKDWQAVWWAGEMLTIIGRAYAENDEYIGRKAVPRLLKQLVRLVSEGHLSPIERAKAGDALGKLGDPRPGVCTLEPQMIRIEGGPFKMGSGAESHKVTLAPFAIAKYAITNAQFRMFMNDGKGGKDGYFDDKLWTPAGLAWRSTAGYYGGYVDGPVWGLDNRPVVGISWHEAIAYINWLRRKTRKPYRLLSEAEWERAAAGTEGRLYAGGNKASDSDVNSHEAGIGQTTAVGIFPKDRTPEGVCDMSGNVWEWTASLDWDYPYKPDGTRERLDSIGGRVVRGGAFERPRSEMRARERRCFDPRARSYLLGFRIGMDVK